MNSAFSCKQAVRATCALAVMVMGGFATTARAATVEEMRRELGQARTEFYQLSAEMHRVSAEMRPLEVRIEELLQELRAADTRTEYNAILAELQEVGGEWSFLRYEQVNLIQEIEFVSGVIAELEAAIAEAETTDNASSGGSVKG